MLLVLVSALVFRNCPASSATAAAEELGPNLVVNGDMEEGDPPASWRFSGATLSADADCHSGSQSLKMVGLIHSGSAYSDYIPVKPDTRYRMALWYKGSEWFGDAYVFVQRFDDPKSIVRRFHEDTWTQLSFEFDTGPASKVHMGFYVWWSDHVLIDDVSLREVGPTASMEAAPAVEAPVEPVDAAQAARERQSAAEALRGRALHGWQALSPGRQYLCWAQSPWDKLKKITLPPGAVEECREISLAMGRNEYESASFVLTNFSDETTEFAVSADDAGIPVTIREAVWVTTFLGKEVNDALPLLEGDLSIPSGENREVWLTLCSRGVEPGDYTPRITVTSPGLPASSVNLNVQVYPVVLPEEKPIYTAYWEYLVPDWITPERAQAQIDDLKLHYVNTPTVHPWSLKPTGAASPFPNEYAKLDATLDYYLQLNPKMVALNLLSSYLEEMPGFFSAEWKALFRDYLTGLVSHLKERGLGYDRFCLQTYDERLDQPVCDVAKLIKEIDPNILVYVNNQGTKTQAQAIAPYVDILCAGIDGVDRIYGSHPPDGNQDYALLAKKPEFLWTYANPMPPFPQAVSPYSWYRMAVWRAWKAGARGFGYWIYSYKTHWDSSRYDEGRRPNWAVVYFADAEDAPPGISKKELVVTSKRWEATREGVEDYIYLYLLREAIEKAGGGVPPQ